MDIVKKRVLVPPVTIQGIVFVMEVPIAPSRHLPTMPIVGMLPSVTVPRSVEMLVVRVRHIAVAPHLVRMLFVMEVFVTLIQALASLHLRIMPVAQVMQHVMELYLVVILVVQVYVGMTTLFTLIMVVASPTNNPHLKTMQCVVEPDAIPLSMKTMRVAVVVV